MRVPPGKQAGSRNIANLFAMFTPKHLKIIRPSADTPIAGLADTMNTDIQIMEKYIGRAIEEFDVNPLASRLMRRLASEAPDDFFPVAVKHLNSNQESNAHRLLTILLLRQDTLLESLASPAFNTREGAVRLFKRFLSVDPSFDVKMARKLPGRTYW